MATTIKPCLPLSPLLKHSISPPPNSSVTFKPNSDFLQISHLSHYRRPQVAASVAFNPQGNFDVSAFEEDDEYENENSVQSRGTGALYDEEGVHCVLLVEVSQHFQNQN